MPSPLAASLLILLAVSTGTSVSSAADSRLHQQQPQTSHTEAALHGSSQASSASVRSKRDSLAGALLTSPGGGAPFASSEAEGYVDLLPPHLPPSVYAPDAGDMPDTPLSEEVSRMLDGLSRVRLEQGRDLDGEMFGDAAFSADGNDRRIEDNNDEDDEEDEGENESDEDLDLDEKRARLFVGKRARLFVGKRPRLFVGKRQRLFVGKRPRLFVGKRPRLFVGKRPRLFVGKRSRLFVGKRPRLFVGKRSRLFVGKRQWEQNMQNLLRGLIENGNGMNLDVYEHLGDFGGNIGDQKRSQEFIGSHASDPELLRRMREFVGKRRRLFVGKRGQTTDNDYPETDAGNLPMGFADEAQQQDFERKRSRLFVGKRADFFSQEEEDPRVSRYRYYMSTKRSPEVVNKRSGLFAGGVSEDGLVENESAPSLVDGENMKRARLFVGKRSAPFDGDFSNFAAAAAAPGSSHESGSR